MTCFSNATPLTQTQWLQASRALNEFRSQMAVIRLQAEVCEPDEVMEVVTDAIDLQDYIKSGTFSKQGDPLERWDRVRLLQASCFPQKAILRCCPYWVSLYEVQVWDLFKHKKVSCAAFLCSMAVAAAYMKQSCSRCHEASPVAHNGHEWPWLPFQFSVC